jgi:hypothetical protein
METMNFTYEEFQYVAHLCRSWSAGLDLKHFLTCQLRHRLPALACKIENLNAEEVRTLRSEIDAADKAGRLHLKDN